MKTQEARQRRQAAERERRLNDPKFVIDDRMSVNIRLSLRGNKAGRKWEDLVGYTLSDLMIHLEKQFVKGMGWANIGEWHIDHITPKSSFKYSDVADQAFAACWALANLRPLWAEDNLKKHAKIQKLI